MAKHCLPIYLFLAAPSFALTSTREVAAQTTYSLSFNGPGSLAGVAGSDQSGDYFCVLRPSGGGAGVQAYSFGVTAVEGTITGAHLAGTTAEALLNPNANDHFVSIHLTSGLGNDGVVIAVQLDKVNQVSLPADAPSTIAVVTLAANIPDAGGIARLRYKEGLQGPGQPVAITLSQAGETRIPTIVEMEVALIPVSSDPPLVLGVAGPDVLPDELTFVYVHGENFTRDTRIMFPGAGDMVDPVALIDEATGVAQIIAGYTPILPLGDPDYPVGWKDVVASDSRGTTTAQHAFYYVDHGDVYLKRLLNPTEISHLGGTRLTFLGRNFRQGLEPRVDNVPCTDVTIIDETLLECTAPDLSVDPEIPIRLAPCQLHDAATGELLSERNNAVYIALGAMPPLILVVEPTEADARGGTPISIRGENFREDTEVIIGDVLSLENKQLVSSELITGIATGVDPLNLRTPPGLNDITVTDRRGKSSLHFAINYVDKIRSVSPTLVSAAGGEAISFEGFGFEEGLTPRLGVEALVNFTRVGTERIDGTTPPMEPGVYHVALTDEQGSLLGYLPSAVEVVPGGGPVNPVISAVTPTSIVSGQGAEIFFEGARFYSGLTPRLDGTPLLGVTFIDAGHFVGFAPELAVGLHDAELVDAEGVVVALLADAVEVLPTPVIEELPAPAAIDAVFAEGQARFSWSNPIAYDRIVATEVFAVGGFGRVFELAGNTTNLLVPATRDGIALELKGFLKERISVGSLGYAYPAECGQPAPLGGYGTVGKFDFPLYGGNLPRLPGRCLPVPQVPANGQGSGGGVFDLGSEWASINGFQELGEGYGVTARNRTLESLLTAFGPHRYSNRLVTGFTLAEDADRLQIEGYYQKLGEAPGLALMGRLVHVFPEDGFEDEFTFPDATPGEDPGWHGFTYFRTDRDVGEAGAQPCNLRIPRGDYILQIYAINGEPDQSYYAFRDDGRDVELLIPGAPCPPYPLVRVRDVSGKRTIPNVTDIRATIKGPNRIEFRAVGNWFDGVSPTPHSIDSADEQSYVPHNFEFLWTIDDVVPAKTQSSGSSNHIEVPVKAIGCHRVHLTIRDRACDRATTVTKQAIAQPLDFACTVRPYVVQDPTPDPSGILAVAGLNPGPGQGSMSRGRELRLRVLVSAESLEVCGGDSRVVAPDVGDLQFRFVWSYVNFLQFPPLPEILEAVPPDKVLSVNLCRSVNNQKYTYFEVIVPDIGIARPLPIWADNGVFQAVHLQWKALVKRVATPNGGNRTEPFADNWHNVTPALKMTNPPRSLSKNHWQGFYSEPEQRYRFVHQSSDNYQSHFALGMTSAVPLELPAGGPKVVMPAMANSFGAGLNTAVELVNGVWRAGTARVDDAGEILSNKVQGSPLQIDALPQNRGGAFEGAGAQANLKDKFSYAWCKQQEIFNKTHEQELFNAMVCAFVIPPGIPVTVWASIGLALKVSITAQAGVLISLFDGLEGGSFVRSDLFFNSELGLHFPASIRADVLYGVASVAFKLRPAVNALFRVHVGNRDLELVKQANLSIFIKLAMEVELCLLSFLKEIPVIGDSLCTEVLNEVILNAELINVGNSIAFEECPTDGGILGINGADRHEPVGAGGDIAIKLEEYFPATKASRDGSVTIDVAYEKSDVSTIRAPRTKMSIKIGDRPRELFSTRTAWELEPSIGFLSNKRALIAWTRSYPQDAIDAGATIRPDQNYSNAELNFFRAHDEIVITPAGETTRPDFWDVAPDFILSDPRDEVPDPAARRVDGRASVAGDETHQDALVAWVRIDDPEYFFLDPQTQQPRFHLEKTAIFARAVDFNGVLDAPQRVSAGGINVEPCVAFSPSGNFAYCVWVHDSNHVDLLSSNRGRNLMYSIFERATNTWSPPLPIFTDPDSHPGMLEPNIALRGDDHGLLAFTALDASADEKDSGLLGGNRYVFISRLVGGVFGPPMLIHGKCEKRVYGSKVVIEIPPRGQDPLTRALNKWEWQVLFQQSGPVLSPEGAGGLMISGLLEGVSTPTPAVAILADGNIRSNVAATATAAGINVVSLNLGPSLRRISANPGIGGGGGIDPLPEGVFESTEIVAMPDLAIASCALSNQFPGPGALVTATVRIDNDGLLGSAVNAAGESLVGLRVLYIDPTGAERVITTVPVPVIDAGTTAEITFTLEQPLDPVRLWVALSPNPIDPNPSNDSAQCFFGTPAPRDFRCTPVLLGEEELGAVTLLTWTNPVLYDEIFLYRDGSMLAAIPGASTTYVDRDATASPHTYEIRARIEVSKSCRVLAPRCQQEVPPQIFRRGDSDANGRLEITDAVVTLGFLFLGNRAPGCFDAADADDSGSLTITDPVRALNYLFLGGTAPPAPGPDDCGGDPTEDALLCDTESPGC